MQPDLHNVCEEAERRCRVLGSLHGLGEVLRVRWRLDPATWSRMSGSRAASARVVPWSAGSLVVLLRWLLVQGDRRGLDELLGLLLGERGRWSVEGAERHRVPSIPEVSAIVGAVAERYGTAISDGELDADELAQLGDAAARLVALARGGAR